VRKYIGYARVSTEDQRTNGASLDVQVAAIERTARERGWDLVHVESEVVSGGLPLARRPGLGHVLKECEDGRADGLLVTKLDRLSRSLVSWAGIVERAQRGRFNLVVIDQAFELATPNGRAMAVMLAVFAQFEREMIAERTRTALRALPRERRGGPVYPEAVRVRARALRSEGLALHAIAKRLTDEGVIPPRGGSRIWPNTVQQLLGDA
jgi:DNA invertase Pin-like site-specific DNA recombinase